MLHRAAFHRLPDEDSGLDHGFAYQLAQGPVQNQGHLHCAALCQTFHVNGGRIDGLYLANQTKACGFVMLWGSC